MSQYPEFWTSASGAHRRVMLKAAGYGDKDIRTKPHIGVPNSFQEGSPAMSSTQCQLKNSYQKNDTTKAEEYLMPAKNL